MKKTILFIIFILPISLSAQEKKTIRYDFDLGERAPIFISYFGDLIVYPGAKLGFNWNLYMIEKTKEKKKYIKTTRKVLYVAPSIAYYVHPNADQGLFIKTDLAWRMYTKKLWFTEFSLGTGYFRQFNTSETWEMQTDGTAKNVGHTSRGYFDYSFSFAFGKQLPSKNKKPLTIYTKLNFDNLTNYNAAEIMEPSLELGVIFTPSWGIKTGKVSTQVKNK